MIVDDIDYNRLALGLIVQNKFGLNYLEAVNGKDCIDQIMRMDKKQCCEGVRLIIMDYEMPVMNGIQVKIQN